MGALLGQPAWLSIGKAAGATRLNPQGSRSTPVASPCPATCILSKLGLPSSVLVYPSFRAPPREHLQQESLTNGHEQCQHPAATSSPLSHLCHYFVTLLLTFLPGFSRALSSYPNDLSLHHYSALHAHGTPLTAPVPLPSSPTYIPHTPHLSEQTLWLRHPR